ncbi:hypothetical protein Pelo_19773 [Pelomyxa schiedti]|nr:hypothetical protein Pelo_19773 [Pelomyxa schiedti]
MQYHAVALERPAGKLLDSHNVASAEALHELADGAVMRIEAVRKSRVTRDSLENGLKINPYVVAFFWEGDCEDDEARVGV